MLGHHHRYEAVVMPARAPNRVARAAAVTLLAVLGIACIVTSDLLGGSAPKTELYTQNPATRERSALSFVSCVLSFDFVALRPCLCVHAHPCLTYAWRRVNQRHSGGLPGGSLHGRCSSAGRLSPSVSAWWIGRSALRGACTRLRPVPRWHRRLLSSRARHGFAQAQED